MCLVKNGFENKRQGRKTQKLEVGCYLVRVLKGIFQRKRKILSEFFMELDEIPLTSTVSSIIYLQSGYSFSQLLDITQNASPSNSISLPMVLSKTSIPAW